MFLTGLLWFTLPAYWNVSLFFNLIVCGSCGYPLNLNSSNRVTSTIGSEYQKSIKKGVISFLSVDLSRFTQVDELL
ncbi:hypothetical protein H6P81_013112 [Aristolochia fimbriata]|uniref:Uncharacterized protein n=1 Tax=Aristolochia fimbriata TaxID=158543 RepID=A0AAV7EE96_ARIFI|nr:hypothetical protein H6P81_013112 [Aristolochia fimbriata]